MFELNVIKVKGISSV